MPAIQLQSLGVTTPDGRDLLPQLDLTFGPRRTGLVGRNGTGKTTLLRVIAGELSPKTGAVQIDGRLGLLRQVVQADGQSVAQHLGIADALARLARIDAGDGRRRRFRRRRLDAARPRRAGARKTRAPEPRFPAPRQHPERRPAHPARPRRPPPRRARFPAARRADQQSRRRWPRRGRRAHRTLARRRPRRQP